jgi:hypothetical protein
VVSRANFKSYNLVRGGVRVSLNVGPFKGVVNRANFKSYNLVQGGVRVSLNDSPV